MSSKNQTKGRTCCALCAAIMPLAALAATSPATRTNAVVSPAVGAAPARPHAQRDVAGLGPAVSMATLRRSSGGTGTSNLVALKGVVTGNSANQVNTGSNTIDSGSFSGAVGLPTVIQNSGNNVLIQSGVTVNVQFKQP